jgi:hypothetical protein
VGDPHEIQRKKMRKEVESEILWGIIYVTFMSDMRDPHVSYTEVTKKEEIKMDECNS